MKLLIRTSDRRTGRIDRRRLARRNRNDRQGGALVEFALLLPILILLILGTLDLGQYTNVTQAISNASREGALVAARSSTFSTSEVDSAVRNYLAGVYPREAQEIMGNAVTVSVGGSDGSLPEGGFGEIGAGAAVSVEVAINYDSIRWLSGLSFLGGSTISSNTIMRKE